MECDVEVAVGRGHAVHGRGGEGRDLIGCDFSGGGFVRGVVDEDLGGVKTENEYPSRGEDNRGAPTWTFPLTNQLLLMV